MARSDGVLVVGSIAQDYVEAPGLTLDGELGGSAAYFALAARTLSRVAVVGCVGEDRVSELRQALSSADLSRLSVTTEATYTWRARRAAVDGDAETLERFAGGYATYEPDVGVASDMPGTVFLGSSDPVIQLAVARAAPSDALMAGDTMDVFIEGQRDLVEEMVERCHVLFATSRELELLTSAGGSQAAADAALERYGLAAVLEKLGSEGAILWTRDRNQRLPAASTLVIDPTGAGDSLAGGMMGRLSGNRPAETALEWESLLEALEWGVVTASFAIEAAGLAGIAEASRIDLERRLADYRRRDLASG